MATSASEGSVANRTADDDAEAQKSSEPSDGHDVDPHP
jgi:hypothetical protein